MPKSISPLIASLTASGVQDRYEQFLHTLMKAEPIEVTPGMITPELLEELEMLVNFSQERLYQSCQHKQLKERKIMFTEGELETIIWALKGALRRSEERQDMKVKLNEDWHALHNICFELHILIDKTGQLIASTEL